MVKLSLEQKIQASENGENERPDPRLVHKDLPLLVEKNKNLTKENTSEISINRMGRNFIDLLHILPQNSPFRQSLVKEGTRGISVKDASQLLSLSEKTIYLSRQDPSNLIVDTNYKPNTKRIRVHEDDDQIAINFLNEHFPVSSGRNHRVIKATKDILFTKYFVYCMENNQNPSSKSYFF